MAQLSDAPGAIPGKLRDIVSLAFYRRLSVAIGAAYPVLFLVALRDISLGGQGFEVLTTDWTRMFERSGAFTFEPMATAVLAPQLRSEDLSKTS